MKYHIRRAVVIGAGTMGAALAAHLANAGVPVTLLDIVPNKLTPDEEKKGFTLADREVRDRIVREGLDRAIKSRPASFFSSEKVDLLKIGNLEDDFDEIAKADWVIEAIIENLEIKRKLMRRIDEIRSPDLIVSTNTSGIPVGEISEGLSQGFRQHFLGTHFFNPPRYLKLLEIIPAPDTLPEVVRAISWFGEYRLGKGIVPCKDTPNFIGNRLAFGSAPFALDYILENGYTVEEVDAITGPSIGHPKTATFRLIDLVGIDVWEHVGRNLAPAIPDDEMAQRYLGSERVNNLIHTMVEKGWLGTKAKQGFYKEVRQPDGSKEFWVLNPSTLEYQAPVKVRFDSIGKTRDKSLTEKMKLLIDADDRAGQLVRALTYQSLAYASERIPEIADTPLPIDNAMKWGFGHEAGPFETWDMLGVAETTEKMKAFGFPAATWVEEMLARGITTFYQYAGDTQVGVYNPGRDDYEPIPRPAGLVVLKEKKVAGKLIKRNPVASLVDLDDGVACVEIHAKMNVLEDDVFTIISAGLDLVETEFEGLVISTDAEHFSAGYNLGVVLMGAKMSAWPQLEEGVQRLQNLAMRMRYFSRPVVVAPVGYTLGGGAEITMHAGRIVAGAELYTGLVEVAQGLIPAGGGTKEMMRRVINPAMRTKGTEVLPFLQRVFEQIGMAKVATSAEEARGLGILIPADRIVMNRDWLITEAKREVLHMAGSGYHPPAPEKIYAAGRDGLAALRVGIYMMQQGGYITEYEAHIGNKLAYVLTGGEISSPAWVSEQYILDLEREAFVSLCGEEKTQARIWNFLQTGKPMRN